MHNCATLPGPEKLIVCKSLECLRLCWFAMKVFYSLDCILNALFENLEFISSTELNYLKDS